MRLNNKGFGAIGVLIIVVVIFAIGFSGWAVYHHNHKTKPVVTTKTTANTKQNSSTKKTTQQTNPYAGWQTYTSSVGSFALKYPSTWQISGFQGTTAVTQVNGQDTDIRLVNTESSSNSFGMDIVLSSKPSDTMDDYSEGTVTSLSNGLSVWIHNQGDPSVDGRVAECPDMQIVSGQTFLATLSNGTSLSLDGSFCWNQKSNPTYTYSQQVDSTSFSQAKQIIGSITPTN
ncbi:MAG: hypothetical protein WDN66_02945 [Candidatus Saccharibacteria bacterium]